MPIAAKARLLDFQFQKSRHKKACQVAGFLRISLL
jgi:hypothetical protein